jgi:hypothetical protein
MRVTFSKNIKTGRLFPMFIYCFVLLSIPGSFIFSATSLFQITTPSDIGYKWLEYDFSFLFIPILLTVPYLYYKYKEARKYYNIIGLILLWNIIYALVKDSYLFHNGYYETLIAMTMGLTMCLIFKLYAKGFGALLAIYKVLIAGNIVAMFAGLILNAGVFDVISRMNLPNMDVGTTGFILATFFILLLHHAQRINLLLIFGSLFLILLTGSRINLLAFCLFLFVFLFQKSLHKLNRTDFAKIVIALLAIMLGVIAAYFFSNIETLLGRALSIFSFLHDPSSDDSVRGRAASIQAGWEVLKKNPLGLSVCFNDVQRNMNLFGYPTFPHSTLLYSYLIFGPLVLIYTVRKFLKRFIRAAKSRSPLLYVFAYIILVDTVGGGAIVNYKIYFIYFMLLLLDSAYEQSFRERHNCQIS